MLTSTAQNFFRDKTITLMGLGLLGRGVGDAAFLARHCKKLYVTDMKSDEDLRESLTKLKDYSNIDFFLGEHNYEIFEKTDFIIKGAGVRLDDPYILHAQRKGVPVYMSTALFAKLSGLKIVGITGTRGKTTTTCMIAEILKHAGKKILLGGNIRGVSTLAMLEDCQGYDYAVLELDSWQLQGFASLGISPNIAIFTNFYPDHMNYYDGNMDRYFEDKAAIFRHQNPSDIFVTGNAVAKLAHALQAVIASSLPANIKLKIPGDHNRANAALARAAALAMEIDAAAADTALQHFEAVEGRLQPVGIWQERTFYNDSNATTQEATLAALTSFAPDKCVLIFGGSDKGLPIDNLVAYIRDKKIRCVLLKGTGSDRVLAVLAALPVVGSMQDAVRHACALSRAGDAVILSPAFASFGLFKNEYDRSDQFLAEITKLTKETS